LNSAEYFISKLRLEKHIEGGYFREIYRSSISIGDKCLHSDICSDRSLLTTIYFLLKSGEVSKFHKLKFDEIWFHHYGSSLLLHVIEENGDYKPLKLGLDIENGELPQVLVKGNSIFGAELLHKNSFSLLSCIIAPGFDYADFTLYK